MDIEIIKIRLKKHIRNFLLRLLGIEKYTNRISSLERSLKIAERDNERLFKVQNELEKRLDFLMKNLFVSADISIGTVQNQRPNYERSWIVLSVKGKGDKVDYCQFYDVSDCNIKDLQHILKQFKGANIHYDGPSGTRKFLW